MRSQICHAVGQLTTSRWLQSGRHTDQTGPAASSDGASALEWLLTISPDSLTCAEVTKWNNWGLIFLYRLFMFYANLRI